MVRWVVVHAVPYMGKSLRMEITQGSLQSAMPGSSSETRERFCGGLDRNIVVEYSVGPMIQTLFPNSDAVFQDDNPPIHTAGTVQS
jgi:hypothetical protein